MLLCLLPTICFALQWALQSMLYSDIHLNGKSCMCVIHQTTCISSLLWDHPMCVCCLQRSFFRKWTLLLGPEHLTDYTILTCTCLWQHFHFMTFLPRYFKLQHVESQYAPHLKYILNWSDNTCKTWIGWVGSRRGLHCTSRRLLLIPEILWIQFSFVPVDISSTLYIIGISIDYSKFEISFVQQISLL